MKFLVLLFLVFFFSCGKKDHSRPDVSTPEVSRPSLCDDLGLKCLALADWTVDSSAENFPKKFHLYLDDSLVFDSCSFPDSIKASPSADGRMDVTFTLPLVPEAPLKVAIVNCESNVEFFSEDNVAYRTGRGAQSGFTVSVTLSN